MDGAEIIVEAGPRLMTDAEARRAVGPESGLLQRDHAPGLFLVAAPGRGGQEGRFRCELEIGGV